MSKKYMIPEEFGRALRAYDQAPKQANWTVYPEYAYDQFYAHDHYTLDEETDTAETSTTASANPGRKRKGRSRARRNGEEKKKEFPQYPPVAGNAGPFLPQMFPYGMQGRPAVYENPRHDRCEAGFYKPCGRGDAITCPCCGLLLCEKHWNHPKLTWEQAHTTARTIEQQLVDEKSWRSAIARRNGDRSFFVVAHIGGGVHLGCYVQASSKAEADQKARLCLTGMKGIPSIKEKDCPREQEFDRVFYVGRANPSSARRNPDLGLVVAFPLLMSLTVPVAWGVSYSRNQSILWAFVHGLPPVALPYLVYVAATSLSGRKPTKRNPSREDAAQAFMRLNPSQRQMLYDEISKARGLKGQSAKQNPKKRLAIGAQVQHADWGPVQIKAIAGRVGDDEIGMPKEYEGHLGEYVYCVAVGPKGLVYDVGAWELA